MAMNMKSDTTIALEIYREGHRINVPKTHRSNYSAMVWEESTEGKATILLYQHSHLKYNYKQEVIVRKSN